MRKNDKGTTSKGFIDAKPPQGTRDKGFIDEKPPDGEIEYLFNPLHQSLGKGSSLL